MRANRDPPSFAAGWPMTSLQRKAWACYVLHIRKAVEWGMHTLQAMWPRLTVPLTTDEEDRALLFETTFLLHNLLQREMVHNNQIKTVFQDAFLRGGGA